VIVPVEIRELIIKTNIVSSDEQDSALNTKQSLTALKQQVVQECLKVLKKEKIWIKNEER
jgi:hypothetical protein